LSVCCITNDPGPRVAAVLSPLRKVADEIVVAADARTGRDRLEQYAGVADRVLRVEFSFLERHLAWLHRECSGDWVFRIDADEVVSPSLVERLPELVADRDVQQYWFPRRWLYPDEAKWLAEVPWWPDYENRLVRNNGALRFSGLLHTNAAPAYPARYIEEPLYHLACLDEVAARRAKAILYEVQRPGLVAPGGGALSRRAYLPELYASRPQALTPPEDLESLRRVLTAEAAPRKRLGDVPVVSLSENDRSWAGRDVDPSAYRVEIDSLEPHPSLEVNETRPIHIRVTNRGSETWPWDAQAGPAIRCAYHWLHANGSVLVFDGHRTSFTCDVPTDATVVVPLLVEAPPSPGLYLLEVDLVHEDVRWFGANHRIPVAVEEAQTERVALPTSALAVPDPPQPTLVGRIRRRRSNGGIPSVIHRVWLGGSAMPRELRAYGETWRRQHPGWKFRLWGDRQLRRLVPSETVARARHYSELSDLLRFEILRRHGGVYVDTDVECLRPLEPLLEGERAVVGYEKPGRIGTAVLAAHPGHPVFVDAALQARRTVGLGANSADATGPYLLTLLVADYPDVTILPAETFYPYAWDEPERRGEDFPDSYAVHHWTTLGR
jgi:inositol phosphorylceramide mannosyltransferase catalytic subunit